jgi:hypothetical protein
MKIAYVWQNLLQVVYLSLCILNRTSLQVFSCLNEICLRRVEHTKSYYSL